ncbi:hypothetical protein K5D38_04980 [Pseudomonas cichorii]|nr:hypothetical protein [Pseudomonas cichorii]MBX8474126.1 hypothetical protein [Pseudomonas cichorii]
MQQKNKVLFIPDLTSFRESPVMLVNQVNPKSVQRIKANPCGCFILPDALSKALQFVRAQGHLKFLSRANTFPSRCNAIFQIGFVLINRISPFSEMVISRAHMSGLRGLFVWKQKAITDVPDSHIEEDMSVSWGDISLPPRKSRAAEFKQRQAGARKCAPVARAYSDPSTPVAAPATGAWPNDFVPNDRATVLCHTEALAAGQASIEDLRLLSEQERVRLEIGGTLKALLAEGSTDELP